MSKKIKFLAYYLPQYHQIPENDEWWGEGFTKWTNVKKAKPLFKGHQQPVIPGELGYYDLLKTEGIQEKQAKLAKEYGIDGFIYYQYWFGNGKMLLEKPAERMLADKNVDIPFCFCWANETWSGIWHGLSGKILAKQTYPGEEDEQAHFDYLIPFFQDDRYIKIDEKPLFIIYDALAIPNLPEYIERMRRRAKMAGFSDIFIVASNKNRDDFDYETIGFDAKISHAFNEEFNKIIPKVNQAFKNKLWNKFNLTFGREFTPSYKIDYMRFHQKIRYSELSINTFPMVLPNWDNTPRSERRGIVMTGSSSKNFHIELKKANDFLNNSQQKHKIIVLKSWNEWAEGNYLEPDLKNKNEFLKVIKEVSNS